MKITKYFSLIFLTILAVTNHPGILIAQDSVDVTFYYIPPGENPVSVYLPGEFNGWQIYSDPMIFDNDADVWHKTKRLRVGGPNPPSASVSVPGAYQYKFNLNGSSDGWINDPLNPRKNIVDHNNNYVYIKNPTIHYLLPNSLSGLVQTRYPEISAFIFPEITSAVNAGSIVITIDDVIYENIGEGYDPQTGKFTFIPSEPVSSGEHKLKLYAESISGSVNEDSTTFLVQAGFIQFLTQSSNRYLRPSITISGITAEPNLVIGFEHIGQESQQVVSDSSGMFSVVAALVEGENKFNAITLDSDDNVQETGILRINYFVDHGPKPSIQMIIDDEYVNIYAAVNDPDKDMVSYKWTSDDSINPEPLNLLSEEEEVVILKPGTPGEYFIDLILTDPDQNQGKTRTFFTINRDGTASPFNINGHASWVDDAVVYEIYLPSFTAQGTIAAAETRLEYIKSLGVNVIWFMPIYENGELINELNAGYNITDFYKVHPQLGTLDDLRHFINTAHVLGMRVILDSTPNHVSSRHPFIKNIELFRDYSNYRPMFETDILGDDRGMGQFKRVIDDYTLYVHYSNWSLPNIDYTSIEARDYMLDMYKYWVIDVGIDGYRMDVYWGPQNRYSKNVWWRPFREEIKRVKPEIFLLGETDGTGSGSENNYADGGGGMDAAYDWTLYGEIKSAVSGGSISNLDNRVRNYSPNLEYNHYTGPNAHYFRFMENHDEQRFASLYPVPKAKTAASLLFTIPGIPMIYAGQEIGETSRRGAINWTRQGAEAMRAHYTKLGQIRRNYSALRTNLIQTKASGNSRLYSFIRPYMDENTIVLLSFSDTRVRANISIFQTDLFLTDSLETERTYYMNDVYNDTVYTVTKESLRSFQPAIEPWGVAVFVLADSAFEYIMSTSDQFAVNLPEQFQLDQNYPNPFNPETRISFSIPQQSHIQLLIYDVLGREVSVLVDTEKPAGNYSVSWQGLNKDGTKAGSGIYFYRLIARAADGNTFSHTKKMIVLK